MSSCVPLSSYSNAFLTFCRGMAVLNMCILCFTIPVHASFNTIHSGEGEGPGDTGHVSLARANFVCIQTLKMFLLALKAFVPKPLLPLHTHNS